MSTGEYLRVFFGSVGIQFDHTISNIVPAFFEYLDTPQAVQLPVSISTNSMRAAARASAVGLRRCAERNYESVALFAEKGAFLEPFYFCFYESPHAIRLTVIGILLDRVQEATSFENRGAKP